MIIWRDGVWFEDLAAVPGDDRGFTLGDGLFETLLAVDGQLQHADLHLDRLERSAIALGLPSPDRKRLKDAMVETLVRSHLGSCRAAVRITITAGRSARGLARDPASDACVLVTAASAPDSGTPVRLVTSRVRRNPASPASRHKTLSYIDSVMALKEAADRGADEAVMLNPRGRPASAATGNLIFRVGGRLLTPPLSEGVLAGTTRARLLAAVPELSEQVLTLREAREAEGLVLTNALRGIRPALSWEGRDLPGSVNLKLVLERALSHALDRVILS